jgi:hypothetical protein
MGLHETLESGCKSFGRCFRMCRCSERLLGKKPSIHIGNGDGADCRPKISDKNRTALIETEKGWTPSARKPAKRPIHHPPLTDKLFGYKRDRTALQSGDASEIGARDGLAAPYQIEDNATIYIASSFARCYLGIGEINALHQLESELGRNCYAMVLRFEFRMLETGINLRHELYVFEKLIVKSKTSFPSEFFRKLGVAESASPVFGRLIDFGIAQCFSGRSST